MHTCMCRKTWGIQDYMQGMHTKIILFLVSREVKVLRYMWLCTNIRICSICTGKHMHTYIYMLQASTCIHT
jgi:hypothetical protein